MRLAITFLVSILAVVTFSFSPASALHHSRAKGLSKHGSLRAPAPQPIARRQYHARRDLIDSCISLDAGILASVFNLLKPLNIDLHLCLCLKDLDIFLDTDVRATVLSELLGGRDKLEAFLKLLINDKSHGQQCILPSHAIRACVSGDPCAFTCKPPYVKVGNACVCKQPLMECNGQCGSFPSGCGSAVPRWQKRTRVPGKIPITTLSEAQDSCKPNESVCGIVGREDTMSFECIDTKIALDSCGGCMTPHPFFESHRSTAKGIDCGRLPGVLGARCSNSKCIVSQCVGSWKFSHDNSECVNASFVPELAINPGAGSLRMRRERRRDEPLASTDASVVVNSALLPQLTALVNHVLDLDQASSDVRASSQGSGSSPSIDHAHLINAVNEATSDILKSPTVASVDKLVHTSTLLKDLLGGCGCVDALGLGSLVHYLDKVIDAALALQKWCEDNPMTVPAHPSGSGHGSSTPPNTSNGATVLGLDDLLAGLLLSSVKSHVDVEGLGSGLNKPLNDLLNSLGIGPANVHPRTLDQASTNVSLNTNVQVDKAILNQINALATLVIQLKNDSRLPTPAFDSSSVALAAPGRLPGPVPPIDENLVDAIIQATASLLKSAYVSSLLVNLNMLIDVNSLVSSTLAGCGCVDDLGLAKFVEDLEKVIAATLAMKDWCAHHPVVVGPSSGSGPSSNMPSPHAHGHDDILGVPIDLGLEDLLTDLGLDVKGDVDTNVELQGFVNSLVQVVLDLQGDSASLPSSPSLPPHPSTGPHDPHAVVSQGLVDAVIQATGSLLYSATDSELLSNVDALLKINAVLGNALSGCECVDDLGLGHLVEDVEQIVKAALAVKNWCNGHGSPTSSSGGTGNHVSPSTPVSINAEDLLKSLGLNSLIKVDGIVSGLGNTISQPVNSLIASLGLGGMKR